mgnify:CR=1 FL=1
MYATLFPLVSVIDGKNVKSSTFVSELFANANSNSESVGV